MKHADAPDDEFRAAAERLGVELPSSARLRLERFERLLLEEAVPSGMIGVSDAPRLRTRHVIDCLRAAAAVRPSDDLAYDVGSGAGLPGIVVAIARPWLRIGLIEPRRRRVAFLELVLERLGLSNASVLPTRLQDVREPADLCFARGFAPLRGAWRAVLPRLRPAGRLVYFAGEHAGRVLVLAGAGSVETLVSPLLESQGPLIIMSR